MPAILLGIAVFSTAHPGTLAGQLVGGARTSASAGDRGQQPSSAAAGGMATSPLTTIVGAGDANGSGPGGSAPSATSGLPATTAVPGNPGAASAPGAGGSTVQGNAAAGSGPGTGPGAASGSGGLPLASPTYPEPCAIGPKLVPTCGVLTGLYSDAPGGVPGRQTEVGHAFNLVRVHKSSLTDAFPTASDLASLGSDTALLVDWDAFNRGGRARWSEIAAGRWNSTIDAEASRLVAYGQPIMVSLMAEMDVANRNGALGTPGDFVAAWRTIVDRMRADGASNVVWVWEVSAEPASSAVAYYPGNDVVDWIAWDPSNGGNCRSDPTGWQSFAQITEGDYNFFSTTGPYDAKPLMLGAFGTVEQTGNAAGKQGWLASVPSQAAAEPGLKALVYFDSTSGCDFAVDSSAASLQGFEAMTNAGY